MQLDTARAVDALDRVGKQLGMDAEQVAIGMVRIINAHMADLIRRATIEQGNDPRDCVLIAYGGAGPTHAGFYGAEINAKAILIPADSTVFSAEGMLTCQVVHSAETSHAVASPFGPDDYAALSEQFGGLEKLVENQFHEEGTKLSDVALRRTLKVRYGLQVHTVSVEVPSGFWTSNTASLSRSDSRSVMRKYSVPAHYTVAAASPMRPAALLARWIRSRCVLRRSRKVRKQQALRGAARDGPILSSLVSCRHQCLTAAVLIMVTS